MVPFGPDAKSFVAPDLSFQPVTLFAEMLTDEGYCPSSHKLSPDISAGSKLLPGIGAILICEDAALEPTALTARSVILYTVPLVNPAMVTGKMYPLG